MSQLVLVVREPYHCKIRGRMLNRGDMITDPDEVNQVLSERPHAVIKRMSRPHEEALVQPPAPPVAPVRVAMKAAS